MRECPWCRNKARVLNTPLGYEVECCKNGHIHNIGLLVPATEIYSKTEEQAKELWNKSVDEWNRGFYV